MADYRNHHEQIRAAGARVVAISVDPPKVSAALQSALNLPFPILCDTERRVVQEWDIYNPREKGGIAKPAAFVVERDRTVRYATVDCVATRVPASEMILVLQSTRGGRPARRKTYIPRLADWIRGIGNLFNSRL